MIPTTYWNSLLTQDDKTIKEENSGAKRLHLNKRKKPVVAINLLNRLQSSVENGFNTLVLFSPYVKQNLQSSIKTLSALLDEWFRITFARCSLILIASHHDLKIFIKERIYF